MVKRVTLPGWLDDYIYGEWGAIYEPRPDEVVLNPEQPYDFVKLYLGTYFPRSYSEAYCIVNNLLDNNLYYEKLSSKEEIYLLDVCCGTGGEIIGAVYALCSRLPNLQRIYIESYDASVDAVRFLYHITSKLNEQVGPRVFITPQQFYIDTERDYRDLMAMTNKTYDFILCFKAINEFVQQKIFDSPYSFIAKGLLPKLSSCGVFILTDVTTPISEADRRFYPQLMNSQVNTLLKEVGGFKTMVPYPCYNYEDRCGGCYMQDIFYVSHSKKYDDRSKIAYRVVGHSDFVRSVRVENQNYRCRVIDPNADKQAPYNRL